MTSSTLLTLPNHPSIFANGLPNHSLPGSPASLSLLTTPHDLSLLGTSLLTSTLLPRPLTRRWLKPQTSTSNLANAVGRSWEIYHYASNSTDPIIDIYTKQGNVGKYSSYFGLSPDYDVDFSILAVNEEGEAPDLDSYADMVLFALLQIVELAREEARGVYGGMHTGPDNSSLALNVSDKDPGIAVTSLVVNGTDWLARIAEESGIEERYLDFRLYPTNLVDRKRRAFRSVIQDKNALADAGTPTCVSWQTVRVLERGRWAVDEFVLEEDGRRVWWPAGEVRFEKAW